MTPTQTLIAGVIMLALIVPLALKRVAFLVKWITDGQSYPARFDNTVDHPIAAGNKHNAEVLGQKKLLRWTLPGIAHAFVMYAFFILLTVYIEAFGILFSRNPKWAIPFIGHWDVLGFAQDTISESSYVLAGNGTQSTRTITPLYRSVRATLEMKF